MRLTLCRTGGCPYYADESGHCPKHGEGKRQETSAKKRANPNEIARQAIYKDKRWRKTCELVLARDFHTCTNCDATEDLVVDHILGVLNCADPFDPEECQTLCRSCSGKKDGGRSWDTR